MSRGQSRIDNTGNPSDPGSEHLLQPGSDDSKGEEKHQSHDRNKDRNGSIFAGEETIQLLTAQVLFALPGLRHTAGADLLNERETHVRHGSTAVQPSFVFQLQCNVLQHLRFVLVQIQQGENLGIALNQFAGGKTDRNSRSISMILNEMHRGVNTAMNGSALIIRPTKILTKRFFLIAGNVDCMSDQLIDTLPLQDGITVIMISHDLGAALQYATHILHVGNRLWYGTREEYLRSEAERGLLPKGGDGQ